MIPDKLTRVWDGVALTSSADSTKSVPLGDQPRDISIGEPMSLFIEVNVAAKTSDNDETYEFKALASDDEALGSPVVLVDRTIARALLTAGSVHELPLPSGTVLKEFIGATYVGGGTNPAVTVTGWFGPNSQMESHAYARSGYTVARP